MCVFECLFVCFLCYYVLFHYCLFTRLLFYYVLFWNFTIVYFTIFNIYIVDFTIFDIEILYSPASIHSATASSLDWRGLPSLQIDSTSSSWNFFRIKVRTN